LFFCAKFRKKRFNILLLNLFITKHNKQLFFDIHFKYFFVYAFNYSPIEIVNNKGQLL